MIVTAQRVLHVIPSVSKVHGGPSEALALIEESLSAAGISVTTVTTDDDGKGCHLPEGDRPSEQGGAKRVYFPKLSEFYKIAPGLVPWLWQNVHHFDVVHIHALFSFTSVAASLAARARHIPYIVRPLGTLNHYGRQQRRPWLKTLSIAVIESPILRDAAAVHFTSRSEWEEAKSLGVPMRGVVIPLAVRSEQEGGEAQDLVREHPALAGRHILLFLSRLDPKKNIEGLIRALAMLTASRDDVALVIAGDGATVYVEGQKRLARALGVDQNIVWLGRVAGAEKRAALAAADVFVLPSLSENFGVAAAEAMLAGLPSVLGKDIAIAAEADAEGAAIMVSPDPEEIAQSVEGLLADRERRGEMGRRAQRFAEREFSVNVMTKRLSALYREVAEGLGEGLSILAEQPDTSVTGTLRLEILAGKSISTGAEDGFARRIPI